MTLWHSDWAWVAPGVPRERVLIEADGERIVRVTPDAEPPPGAARLHGLAIPGLADAHSHAFQRALRGRTQLGADTFWTWRDEMYRLAEALDPDTFHDLALATYAEMALAGITAVGEFHYLHHAPGGRPYADPNEMGQALAAAAAGAGIRLTLLDSCYLRGGFDRPLEGTQRRFGDGSVEAWATRAGLLADGPGLRVGAAIHSVRAVDEASMAAVAAWAETRDTPLHVHVSEQLSENEACRAATGRTPAALLAQAGVLGPRATAVHATHVSREDVRLLGRSGAAVCLCPTTERDLADGIGPAAELAAAGSALCLGSDSQAAIDLFEEARAVELDQRLASGRRGHHRPEELMRAATAGGMQVLGWDAGELAPGRLADFVLLALGSVRLAGWSAGSLLAQVVHAATAADVTDVVVGGRRVVAGGRHVALGDVPGLLHRAVRRAWALAGT